MFVTVTKYLSVLPGTFSRELGEIPTQTPGRIDPTAETTQLALSFTAAFSVEAAVTVILSLAPSAVPTGMVTLSVTFSEALDASGPTEYLERVVGQLALSILVNV